MNATAKPTASPGTLRPQSVLDYENPPADVA